MSWFVLIFISSIFFSLCNLFDKFFCEKKFKNVYAFASAVTLLSTVFILGLSFFIDFSFTVGRALVLTIVSGPIYFLMWVLWWQSLKSGEVSRSIAIFNTAPIFNAFLATLFLGEQLGGLKWVAIFLIVAGAIICSWETKNIRGFNPTYSLAVLAAMVGAVGNAISKSAIGEIGPFAMYAISFYASLPLYLFLLLRKEVLAEVKANLGERKIRIALFVRSLLGVSAICFFYLALSSGPVSLVAAVNAIGPLLVFIYSIIISLFWPKILKENLTHKVLFLKAIAIIFVVVGVTLLSS